jgi:hypothetical protein
MIIPNFKAVSDPVVLALIADLNCIANNIGTNGISEFDKGKLVAYVNVLSADGLSNEFIKQMFIMIAPKLGEIEVFK